MTIEKGMSVFGSMNCRPRGWEAVSSARRSINGSPGSVAWLSIWMEIVLLVVAVGKSVESVGSVVWGVVVGVALGFRPVNS